MQREIRDIIDELGIIIHVVRQQEQVITKYTEQALEILENRPKDKPKDNTLQTELFKKRAKALICELEIQIKELEELKRNAESTAQNVSTLCTHRFGQAIIRGVIPDNNSGRRSDRPQAATSRHRAGVPGDEAGRGDDETGQGNHAFYHHDHCFCRC